MQSEQGSGLHGGWKALDGSADGIAGLRGSGAGERAREATDDDSRRAIADAAAGRALLRAAGAGAMFSAAFELALAGSGLSPITPMMTDPGPTRLLWLFAPMLVPAVLIIAAYLVSAHTEHRLGIRQQRGALAVLVFLALIPLPPPGVFSGMYGVALLLLAVRTRDTLTTVVGVMALCAFAGVSFLGLGWASVPVLLLLGVAAFLAAQRVRVGFSVRG